MNVPVFSSDFGRLYHGDCLDVLAGLPSSSVDLVLTDPPYSSCGLFRVDRVSGGNTKYVKSDRARTLYPEFSGETMDQRSFCYWSHAWLSSCLRVTKESGMFAIFSDWRQLPILTDAVQAAGWVWRGIMVWDKTESCRPQLGRPRQQSEFILWGSKGRLPAEGPVLPGVFRQAITSSKKEHPTAKPVELMMQLAGLASREDAVVLDPFSGSGTTAVACERLKKRWISCEIEESYIEIAKRRLGRPRKTVLA